MDTALRSAAPPMARILLALLYLFAGIRKLGAIGATVAAMTSHGIPAADLLVYGAIIVEIGGGLLLILGWQARWAALVMALYTLALALIFHPFWLVEGAQRRSEFNAFFGHLAMIGGMLYVYAFGAGACSFDRAQGHARLEPASLPAR